MQPFARVVAGGPRPGARGRGPGAPGEGTPRAVSGAGWGRGLGAPGAPGSLPRASAIVSSPGRADGRVLPWPILGWEALSSWVIFKRRIL